MSIRKHIFRAKSVSDGEWVYGDLIHYITPCKTRIFIRTVLFPYVEYDVEEDTIGEFIGLCDSDKGKIYEGDIILCHGHRYIVKWLQEYSGFVYQQVNGKQWYHLTTKDILRVIGNIHDDKDLLKKGE